MLGRLRALIFLLLASLLPVIIAFGVTFRPGTRGFDELGSFGASAGKRFTDFFWGVPPVYGRTVAALLSGALVSAVVKRRSDLRVTVLGAFAAAALLSGCYSIWAGGQLSDAGQIWSDARYLLFTALVSAAGAAIAASVFWFLFETSPPSQIQPGAWIATRWLTTLGLFCAGAACVAAWIFVRQHPYTI